MPSLKHPSIVFFFVFFQCQVNLHAQRSLSVQLAVESFKTNTICGCCFFVYNEGKAQCRTKSS